MANTVNLGLPKPDPEANVDDEFVRLQGTLDQLDAIIYALQQLVATKAASDHTHTIAQVQDLAQALADKMNASKTFTLDDLQDVDGAAAAALNYVLVKNSQGMWVPSSAIAALGVHEHSIAQVQQLQATLDALAALDLATPRSLTPAQKGRAIANIGGGLLAGFRNKLINGGFDIWQRTTSTTISPGSLADFRGPDRWRIGSSLVSGDIALSLQRHVLGQTDVPGNPKFFAQLAGSSAVTDANGYLSLAQQIEGVETFAGKTVTITGYARVASGTKKIGLHIDQNFGTGGSPSGTVKTNIETQFTVGTSWTEVQATVPIPSISGKTLGSNDNDFLRLFILITSKGSDAAYYGMSPELGDLGSNTIQLSRFSLVEGDATAEDDPFSPRHIQQEIALCRRYFLKLSPVEFKAYSPTAGEGVYAPLILPVKMRKQPTITPNQSSSSNANTGTTIGGFADGSVGYVQLAAAAPGYVRAAFLPTFDAEL